jgi:hypothetical protein
VTAVAVSLKVTPSMAKDVIEGRVDAWVLIEV